MRHGRCRSGNDDMLGFSTSRSLVSNRQIKSRGPPRTCKAECSTFVAPDPAAIQQLSARQSQRHRRCSLSLDGASRERAVKFSGRVQTEHIHLPSPQFECKLAYRTANIVFHHNIIHAHVMTTIRSLFPHSAARGRKGTATAIIFSEAI